MTWRETVRIARWEVEKSTVSVDRRTVAWLLAGVVLIGALGGVVTAAGFDVDAGIYTVGVDDASPLYEPVEGDPTFTVEAPSRARFGAGALDVLVDGDAVYVSTDRKGRAAISAVRTTVQQYNDRVMAQEPDQTAAFPVYVTVRYVERDAVQFSTTDPANDGTGGDGGVDVSSDARTTPATDSQTNGFGGKLGVPSLGGGVFAQDTAGTPASIAPPFPFESLVLAYLFILPLNFVIQAYGSSIISERVNRRGELLLVTPASRYAIVAGKTLPYLALSVLVTVVIAALIGGGPVSILAVLPLSLLFLAATFVGGLFARSFKELTFVTVAVSVALTTYAFVPAIFTDVTPIALISPLTLVVRDLQNVAVTPAQYAFSTGPIYLSAAVLYVLGVGVYREEDLFTQRSVPLKALDALASRVRGYGSIAILSAAFIPFVFATELIVIALLFALPFEFSVAVLLVAIAFVEEAAKSLHVYAGYRHGKLPAGVGSALAIGSVSGIGFFLGEKTFVIAQIIGLSAFPLGRLAFSTGVTGPSSLLLLAPLALHVGTAAISSVGASRGRSSYLASFSLAVAVHVAYNAGVMLFVA